jgi:hypothetical protein
LEVTERTFLKMSTPIKFNNFFAVLIGLKIRTPGKIAWLLLFVCNTNYNEAITEIGCSLCGKVKVTLEQKSCFCDKVTNPGTGRIGFQIGTWI